VSGQCHVPAALNLGVPPIPIGWEAGCASELVWTQRLEERSFTSAGIEPLSSSLWSDTIVIELIQVPIVDVTIDFSGV
jgi:hypothetical protein